MSTKRGRNRSFFLCNFFSKNRRGQVTIFIIIAIILVASVTLFFVVREQLGISRVSNDPVYLFTQSCIEDTGKDAILYITENGGYLYPITLSTTDGLPYYYYNNQSYMPSKERIEEEISAYMEQTLSYCIDDFSDFPNANITDGNISATAKISNNEVILNVAYPITLNRGGNSVRFEDFKDIVINSRIDSMYDSILEIENSSINNICLSCIYDILEQNGFTLELTSTNDGMIFYLKDENFRIKDIPIEWRFANKY